MVRAALAIACLATVSGCGGGKTAPTEASQTATPPPAVRPEDPLPAVTKAATPAPPPAPRDILRPSGSTIPGWGEVADPDGDCVFREHDGFVTLSIPATAHDINPTHEGRNAPRVVRPIRGDFRAVVRVAGDFIPKAGSSSKFARPFHGAGLVFWQDERNFLALFRNSWSVGPGRYDCYAPLFELFEDGQPKNTNPGQVPAATFQGQSTALYLERRGNTLKGAYSHDGVSWEGWRDTPTQLSPNAFIGIAAGNTAAEEFKVRFDGFKILDE